MPKKVIRERPASGAQLREQFAQAVQDFRNGRIGIERLRKACTAVMDSDSTASLHLCADVGGLIGVVADDEWLPKSRTYASLARALNRFYSDPDIVKDAMTPARRIADALFTLAETIENMGMEAAMTKTRESFYGDNDERDTVRELIAEVREWLDDLENDVRKKE
jgi:hypothetical protein